MRKNVLMYLFAAFLVCTYLTSCKSDDIDPPVTEVTPPVDPDPTDPEPTAGLVVITPNLVSASTPRFEYRFYPTDGDADNSTFGCDGQGTFKNSLSPGKYRVLATSVGARDIDFRGMESCTTATVHASTSSDAANASYTMLCQPGDIYAAVIPELISAGTDVFYSITPVLLTKTIKLEFSLPSALTGKVTALEGLLHGVLPSVNLLSCNPETASGTDYAVAFSAVPTAASCPVEVKLFGLCDPEYGSAYTNTLSFSLSLSDGDSETFTVDLTGYLSDAFSRCGGSFPSDLYIPVEIRQTAIGGLSCTLANWQSGGETDHETAH